MIHCRPFRNTKTTKINIWNRALNAIFYFTKSFLASNIVSPPGKYLRPSSIHFFSDTPHFQNMGLKVPPPSRKGERILWISTSLRRLQLTRFWEIFCMKSTQEMLLWETDSSRKNVIYFHTLILVNLFLFRKSMVNGGKYSSVIPGETCFLWSN